jgi:hypothetical protein
MVNGDMARCRRLLLAVLAAVALLAFPTVALASPSEPSGRSVAGADALATSTAAVRPAVADRSSRPPAPHGADSRPVVALLVGVVAFVALVSSLTARARSRLTDVGDRWRCLLFGAPPVLAHS